MMNTKTGKPRYINYEKKVYSIVIDMRINVATVKERLPDAYKSSYFSDRLLYGYRSIMEKVAIVSPTQ